MVNATFYMHLVRWELIYTKAIYAFFFKKKTPLRLYGKYQIIDNKSRRKSRVYYHEKRVILLKSTLSCCGWISLIFAHVQNGFYNTSGLKFCSLDVGNSWIWNPLLRKERETRNTVKVNLICSRQEDVFSVTSDPSKVLPCIFKQASFWSPGWTQTVYFQYS